MTGDFFKIAIKETISENDFNSLRDVKYSICPDQYVGKIKDFESVEDLKPEEKSKNDFHSRENIFEVGTTNAIEKNILKATNILILILESPHTKEFDKEGNPIGPANGKTGENIRKYITEILGSGYNEYHLILMNAVPFQCSLGVNTKYFREDVFKKIWSENGKQFFFDRLTGLLNTLSDKNIVIANCCTKGYNATNDSKIRPFLWHLVQDSIETLTSDKGMEIQYFRTSHPSSWSRNKKNREVKEKMILTIS